MSHDIRIDPESNEDEPTCEECGRIVDMVWVHLPGGGEGHCSAVDAEHWRDGDVCGYCGAEWIA